MELKLLGLYGPSRCGKDSVSKILQDDYGFEQRAMADGIREILLGLNPILKDNGGVVWELLDLYDQCHGDWDKIKAMSSESVDLMINLGQSCRDVLGETVWLDRVLPNGPIEGKVVISDVRQVNEYEAIKARGGQIWRVTRPQASEKRGMDGMLDGLEFDFHVENNGSLIDLRSVVQAAMANDFERNIYGKRF